MQNNLDFTKIPFDDIELVGTKICFIMIHSLCHGYLADSVITNVHTVGLC